MKNLFSKLFLSKGVNYFSGDAPLVEALDYFQFGEDEDLVSLGRYVSEELIESLDFIDHYANPVLQTWGILGDRIDYVRLSPDHARALAKLQEFGVVRKMSEEPHSLMYHFVSGYVISDSGIFCTMTLTAQTAYALEKYGAESVRQEFLKKYYDRENPWFGATFYSEIQGGSDIGANQTLVRKTGNRYLLTGSDKYFASDAGIADGAVVTARFENSPAGAKGISFYFVPAYRNDGSPNYSIRRLKDKLGTVAVPTGEVEFNQSEAWLLGRPEDGIYMAMEVLVISRIDDAIAAVGIARKALWEAYLYSNNRKAFGKKLIEHPLMYRDFIEKEVELEAALAISLLAARSFDSVSHLKPPYNEDYQLARLIGNMAKSIAADTSAEITRYAMEMIGGTGFFEEFPMAKFHRDSIVTSIWEGTSNIQALEILEVILKKDGTRLLREFLEKSIHSMKDKEFAGKLLSEVRESLESVKSLLAKGEPEFYAKEVLQRLGRLTAAIQMQLVGENHSRLSGIFTTSAGIYFDICVKGRSLDYDTAKDSSHIITWMKTKSHNQGN